MKTTYTVTQAQAALPRLLKQAKTDLVTVTRRDMADPDAMQQIADCESGRMRFFPLPKA